MAKNMGLSLICLALVWLLYILGMDLVEVQRGDHTLAQAIGHIALVGLLPCLIVSGIGGGLLVIDRRKETEDRTFDYQHQVLDLLNKEERMQFNDIYRRVPLNPQQLRTLLIKMGTEKLFTGYVNWDRKEVICSEDLEIDTDECPACHSLTSPIESHVSVCTRCETYIFASGES